MSVRITSKRQMFSMLRTGEFGNTLRTWDSLIDALDSGYDGLFGLQGAKVGKWFRTGMTSAEAQDEWRKWTSEDGLKPEDIVWCEYLPADQVVMNGEVRDAAYPSSRHTFTLKYNPTPGLTQRAAMSHPDCRTVEGAAAKAILRHYFCHSSYDTLEELLEKYSEATIEFSVSDTYQGSIPHRNTIFWEVRSY